MRKLWQGCRSWRARWFSGIQASLGPTPSPGSTPCRPRAEPRRILHNELQRRGPQPPALQLIQQEAERMGTLVSDLLDLARNDSGRLHLRCRPLH
ncbi:MAG: histidine kinase dimerization/phospho-acceptor domain-containing protein, partial [Cyanobium sp.]